MRERRLEEEEGWGEEEEQSVGRDGGKMEGDDTEGRRRRKRY